MKLKYKRVKQAGKYDVHVGLIYKQNIILIIWYTFSIKCIRMYNQILKMGLKSRAPHG